MKQLTKALRWLTAAVTAALAVLLAWQCVDMFLAGNAPANLDEKGLHILPVFTVDAVRERIRAIAPALYGYALLAAASFALQALYGSKEPEAPLTNEYRLALLRAHRELSADAVREEKRRRTVVLLAGAAELVCALPALLWLLNAENFSGWDLERVMGRLLLHVGLPTAAALAIASAASAVLGRSAGRECDMLRDAPRREAAVPPKSGGIPVGAVRLALLSAAVLFIVLGVMNGGLWDVLVKAVNICTECIGLG